MFPFVLVCHAIGAEGPEPQFEARLAGGYRVRFYQDVPDEAGTLELDGPGGVKVWQRHDFDCVASPMAAGACFVVQHRYIVVREGGPVYGAAGRIDRAGVTADLGDALSTRCFRVSDGRNIWNDPFELAGAPVVAGPGRSIWGMLPHPSPRHPYFIAVRIDAATGNVLARWKLPYRPHEPSLFSLADFGYRYRVKQTPRGSEIVGISSLPDDPKVDLLWQPQTGRLSAARQGRWVRLAEVRG